MANITSTIREFQTIDTLARRDCFLTRLHPLLKVFVTLAYIVAVVSRSKYDIAGLIYLAIYPILVFGFGGLSFRDCLRRLRIVLPLVCIVGIFNPIFDREVVMTVGGVGISGGVLSMVTLMMKGVLCVLAGYLLIANTTIEGICRALRILHVPKIIVTVVLLIYRYMSVLLSEVGRVTRAYALRAPGQRGIAFGAWGSLVGLMLLRSMDRAGEIYESMKLRGFDGEFPE